MSATQLFHSCSDSKDFVLGRKRGREERSEGEREGEILSLCSRRLIFYSVTPSVVLFIPQTKIH